VKYLFLDIDGVMNSAADWFSTKLISDKPFELLKKIIDETGAKIILSSSWRAGYEHGTCDRLKQRLAEYGMAIEDVTPINNNRRGEQIREWLITHDYDENVDTFAILDDEDFDILALYPEQMVKTDEMVGLTDYQVWKCIDRLNRKK
jgi:hypothetical protein